MKRLLAILVASFTVLGAGAKAKKEIVAYFSATGTTEAVAKQIVAAKHSTGSGTEMELYAITPAKTYTTADLDWHNKKSRSSVEMADAKSRPALKGKKNLSQYDVIYLGFPIWWGVAPRIINTFIEQANMKGKTVVVFVTSGSSPVTKAFDELKSTYPNINWQKGYRLSNPKAEEIKNILQ